MLRCAARRSLLPGTAAAVVAATGARSVHSDTLGNVLQGLVTEMKEAGTYKTERVITSQQDSAISTAGTGEGKVINFCANNYLGLANNQRLIDAAHKTLDTHGLGLASVRFICGTQDIHKTLEQSIARFHKTEDAILFPSCFDANAGLFEAILTPEDAVISDELNHASIIDGIRLCKAKRHRFRHMDMEDLEKVLQETQDARLRLIATDGVFSMDGHVAPLRDICALAERYDALVFIDECHATGFMGPTGRGTAEHFDVIDKVAIINSTLGKALGGATGGYTTGRADVIDILRQKARPYLFSNSVAPAVVGAGIEMFKMLEESTELRDRVWENTNYFKDRMCASGLFDLPEGELNHHPIVPVMLGDAALAARFAEAMLAKGIYVIGFSYPVVPKGKARIRVQISAAHTKEQLDQAVDAFIACKRDLV